MTNVLILTIAFFVIFVAGIFVGRELTYLADKRARRKRFAAPPPKRKRKDMRDIPLPDVPPVAGGYIDDESKHWPKTK